MSDDLARKLAIEQRKRLVASIMSYLEHNVYAHLSHEDRQALRTKMLDSIGTYHDFVLDVLKVNRDDVIQNQETLRLLQQLHSSSRRIEHALDGPN